MGFIPINRQEDEKLLQLCIEHEPSLWGGLFSSNKQVDEEEVVSNKIRKMDSHKLIPAASSSVSDDDHVEQDPWAEEDELLFEMCIKFDPWNYNFCWDKTQKSSSAVVGNLRRVSSVGNIRRVHSRTRLA